MAYDYDRRQVLANDPRWKVGDDEIEIANAYKGWETRREREQAVTVNLPADLLPLWERVKYQFKGPPSKRLRDFLEYVHSHEGEGVAALQGEADRKLQRMIRDLKRQEQAVPPYRPAPAGYPASWDLV